MPHILALVGLIIGAALYYLLVRRRVIGRLSGADLARALSASNLVALARIRDAPRRRADALAVLESGPGAEVVPEHRSGEDRRGDFEPWRGRGRRTGGDRRRN